ncbi:MAG: protein kinase [Dehalococcoidia bacterium]
MPSDRMQRRLDALLDEADAAVSEGAWTAVAEKARAALAIDVDNADALTYLRMAEANLGATPSDVPPPSDGAPAMSTTSSTPEAFAGGRYRVARFLGEGGKKRVFLAHDTLLDRDVAFSLIKTDGLDDVGRERIVREAQAMGRLTHPHIVSIFDIGEHTNADGSRQPYLVQELMAGGDVEGLLEDAGGGLPLARALRIAIEVCRGLEFAHGQGVVHRDLKPGNVWLAADGTAKLGDLGLAVQMGRTRLTQHGMMVGTFGYMPPEQALGAEITPGADLYSLGAMLYELVTGRPPFQGDTPTAVISQHLNATPVAPSWYSDHCPPDLEALILRLLAKRPEERPASAAEVRAALEAVDPEGRSRSHSDSQANPLERLARGVFVGRERELEQLQGALDAAFQRRGSITMLVGEPGIGKTRTVQELETYARMRGATVLWGRAHETAGAPAFWPWVQIGNQYSTEHDLAALGPSLPPTVAPELTRLFPWLRDQGGVADPPPAEPAVAEFRLYEAFTRFLAVAAERAPLVVVLDDLHWADKPTLLLLRHLARELGRTRILVVGTYRDTELARTHPLSEALAELNREGGFQRIVLRGLERSEVASYVRQQAGGDVATEIVDRVFEETEGNPFFLAEVVNLMAQEGTLTAGSVSDIAIPDGVREALGRRLDRISEETNALLQVAAVVGREFTYDTLSLLGERTDDELLRMIEEGLAARVIEELPQPGRYRFTHALMQETLLDELTTTRRVRLHGQVGEALERRWGPLAEERAPRLALHFLESSTLTSAHAEKAYRYATLAAEQAEARQAWSEAARWWGQAVSLIESEAPPADADLAQALYRWGRAQELSADYREAWRNLNRALDLFRERRDGVGFARAVLALPVVAPYPRLKAIREEALELLGDAEPELEALLLELMMFSKVGFGELPWEPASASLLRDEPIYRRLQTINLSTRPELAARVQVLGTMLEWMAEPSSRTNAGIRLESALRVLVASGSRRAATTARQIAAGQAFMGDIARFVHLNEEAIALAERLGDRFNANMGRTDLAAVANSRGDSAEVARLLDETVGTFELTDLIRFQQAFQSGDLDSARAALPSEVSGTWAVPYMRALLLSHLCSVAAASGDFEAARALAVDLGNLLVSVGVGVWRLVVHGFLPDARLLSDLWDPVVREREYDYLLRVSPVRAVYGSLDRQRATLALSLDRMEEAETWFKQSLDWSREVGFVLDEGQCLLGLAEVAERRGDHDRALELLDRAGELFARIEAKYFLDKVIARKEVLKA